MRDHNFTKILCWPGYRVYRYEIKEEAKTLRLWVRRKRGNRKLECSGCGRKLIDYQDCREREVRDLPWGEFRTTVVVEVYRGRCPDCGLRVEKVPQLPSKAPFSKRFEEAVGLACEGAAARQVARHFGLAASTVRAIDLRYLERWAAGRRKPTLKEMGVDEIYVGKKTKFLIVVSNLEAGEPMWFGEGRKQEVLDGFFQTQLSGGAAGTDRDGVRRHVERIHQQYSPARSPVPDRLRQVPYPAARQPGHRRGAAGRVLPQGWKDEGGGEGQAVAAVDAVGEPGHEKKRQLNTLFALNRRVMKAYLLKESLERLWNYRYEGAMRRYLKSWIGQLRWQWLKPFQKLAEMLLNHLEGILNYCRTRVRFGVVEAINGNIKALLRRGRGYKNFRYLLLKTQRIAATKTEFIAVRKVA